MIVRLLFVGRLLIVVGLLAQLVQWGAQPNSAALFEQGAQAQTALPPATYYVTQRSNRAIARVDVDAAGHTTVQTNYVGNLPAAGPDSVIFDHEGHLIVSNSDAGTLSQIDPAQRLITRPTINTTNIPVVADMALDPFDDVVWAIHWNGAQ